MLQQLQEQLFLLSCFLPWHFCPYGCFSRSPWTGCVALGAHTALLHPPRSVHTHSPLPRVYLVTPIHLPSTQQPPRPALHRRPCQVPQCSSLAQSLLIPRGVTGSDRGDFDKSDIKRMVHSLLIIYIALIGSSWTHPVPLLQGGSLSVRDSGRGFLSDSSQGDLAMKAILVRRR